MSNRTNPFRVSLSHLAKPRNGEGLETFRIALPLALKALFIEGQMVGTTVLIREATPWRSRLNSDWSYASHIVAGADAGWIRRESHEGDGVTNSAMAFDLTASSPSFTRVTFDTVLASYLASGVTEAAQRSAIAATRNYLNLPKHTQLHGIMRAAASIDDRTFHRLPWRCLSEAIERAEIDKKTAQNFASALRAVMSHGLERDLFPLYFPEPHAIDSYSGEIRRAFPLASFGATERSIRLIRAGLKRLAEVLRDDLGIISIEDVTKTDVRSAVLLLQQPQRMRAYGAVKALRTVVDQVPLDWARTKLAPIFEVVLEGRRVSALPYLTNNDISGVTTDLDSMIKLLTHEGLPESWGVFLRWYRDFSCCTEDDLLEHPDDFPIRQPLRKIARDTFTTRLGTIRAYLGVAINVLRVDAAQLEPERVFGPMFEEISTQIRSIWKAGVGNGVSHRASTTLSRIIYGGGLIAEALYVRSLHARRRAAATKVGRKGASTMDYDEEEIALDRTPSERSLFQSYRHAQKIGANIDRARREDSPLGNGNTIKDLGELVLQAPVTVYTRVQTWQLSQVLPLVSLKRPLTRDERALVVVTLFNGIMLSAGLRIGEPATLRVGIHLPAEYDVGDRIILRHNDRKNRRRHPFTFREEFLPSWFLMFYRSVVWPSLLSLGGHTATPAPWLILHPASGKPFVNADEGMFGENRDSRVRRTRSNEMRRLWRVAIGDACRELGISLPGTAYTVTPHCVRNVVANEIFQELGQADTAAFLGDREGSVVGVYGELNGMSVDSSKVVGQSRVRRS
ncbi:MAG TPA: hypothetical protein VII66_08065 [Gemmatimonadaceae bacterium]